MRTTKSISVEDPDKLKNQLLQWSRQFDEVIWLDSNKYQEKNSSYDAVLAVQAFTAIKTDYHNAFEQLREYQEITADWIFGYLSYDLKNDVEELNSANFDGLQFPELYFFQPQKLFLLKEGQLEMHYLRMVDDEIENDLEEIFDIKERGKTEEGKTENSNKSQELRPFKVENPENDFSTLPAPVSANSVLPAEKQEIKTRISREAYLEKVCKMLAHIQRGDIYEANFCQEFYIENREIEPVEVFKELNDISVPPFATFLKLEEHYLISASPERYLKKSGQKILSQPIKGTARRSENLAEDLQIARALANDPKEKAENVMIVDLVRNDLSRIAKKGSVRVEELCKVYSFKQVHQMISTVSAHLKDDIAAVESLRSTFPMGSMTGAPKISAMKIIEELEETKRGLYSGAVGYFTPAGDFDFNVVIRSILYNSAKKYISFSVGGAITAQSAPQKEYEECMLKAGAMLQVLLK